MEQKIINYFKPTRIALSRKYPKLAPGIIFVRRLIRKTFLKIDPRIETINYNKELLPYVIARHSSPLMRKLGDSDTRLQKQKIINLRLATQILDGIVIRPGKIFSLWNVLGNPTYNRGFVDGMLISNGKVIEGVGGGLCQLSNLLNWAFLHTPLHITERAHHSFDVFPDFNRTLPFGSGATIFYNLIDFRVKNTLQVPIQIHIWMTEQDLKIQIRSSKPNQQKYHVFEKNHQFIESHNVWFRTNEIWREIRVEGKKLGEEKIYENFAPVMYPVTDEYITTHQFKSSCYSVI